MTDFFQFFENSNKSILQQEMNEFCTGLDPDYFELVEIRLQEPNWDRAMIHYRSLVPPDKLQEVALKKLEHERLKKEEEKKKQYSDEDLKKIAEQNAKKEGEQEGVEVSQEYFAQAFNNPYRISK
jgi:hypothetical protein